VTSLQKRRYHVPPPDKRYNKVFC